MNINSNKNEDTSIQSKVNINIPKHSNCVYNNLYENFKDGGLRNHSEDKNKELNSKIKLLVDKIKEKKSYEVKNIYKEK